jgi:hypothetical protein
LGFVDTANIKGSFDSSTGILTLTGDDTFDHWNAALQSVTFNYSGTSVNVAHPNRTITFKADNGTVLSTAATRVIHLVGTPVSPPSVTGTSVSPLTWTEQLPPASPQVITIAPNLLISFPGDIDRDGQRTIGDVFALMDALRDLKAYQNSHTLSDAQVTAIADTNLDGKVNNLDVQALIGLLANNPGSTSQLTSATASISANFSSGNDALGWDNSIALANGITVTASPNFKNLTLTPTSGTSLDLTNFQSVLRTVTFTNSSKNPSTTQRTVTFTVVDANGTTSNITPASQQTINIVAVNNPAAVTTSVGSDSYTAGAAAILVDGAATVTDPDSATLTGATVSITSGFTAGDTLAFTNQLGISGSYNSASGVLTLTGTAPPSDYQVALRAVTFSTGSGAPAGTRTISFIANDGGPGTGNIATKNINISAGGGGSLQFASSLSAPATKSTPLSTTISPSLLSRESTAATSKRSSSHSSVAVGPSKAVTPGHADWALAITINHSRHSHSVPSLSDILDHLFAKWSES